jgi:hypothetical protein
VLLDGAFGEAEATRDMPVRAAFSDKASDLVLAWHERTVGRFE